MEEQITASDRRRHLPDEGQEAGWQESYFLGWVDISTLSAGSHHVSLSPVTRSAHGPAELQSEAMCIRNAERAAAAITDLGTIALLLH